MAACICSCIRLRIFRRRVTQVLIGGMHKYKKLLYRAGFYRSLVFGNRRAAAVFFGAAFRPGSRLLYYRLMLSEKQNAALNKTENSIYEIKADIIKTQPASGYAIKQEQVLKPKNEYIAIERVYRFCIQIV